MFKKIINFIKYMKYSPQGDAGTEPRLDKTMEKIPSPIDAIEKHIKKITEQTVGIVVKPFILHHNHTEALMVYIDGLVDTASIELHVLRPLMTKGIKQNIEEDKVFTNVIHILVKEVITAANTFTTNSMNEAMEGLFGGHTLIFIENTNEAIVIDAKGWTIRAVEEPQTDTVVRGPREGFIEDLQTNISLIRRKFKNPKLKFEPMIVGKHSKTVVAICYIEGRVNQEILEEVKRRIGRMNVEVVLDSGYIEQCIEDSPLSLFPLVGSTEKPDVVLGKILEGRVALFVDGSPFVLTVPQLFIEHIQTCEDYYRRNVFSSSIRFLRILALLITTTSPAIYVAAQTFHQEFIPFQLFISMAAAREGLPFSSFIEALLMIVVFELIKEAGIRMPKPIGQAVSIVGAIILGQAAVEANIASPLMVIIVSTTAISSFIIPALDESLSFIRIFLLILGSILGFYGITFGIIMLIIYMSSLKSFGVNYLFPMAPIVPSRLKDTLVRPPLWNMWKNTKNLFPQNKK